MTPSGIQYHDLIVPLIVERSKGCCEVCGKGTFLWITTKDEFGGWDGMDRGAIDPLPFEKSNLIAVCYKCSGPYLKETPHQSGMNQPRFVDWDVQSLTL